jgi:hypothetical protein
MDHATIAYGLTWVGTGAWVVCFWWMHRISARQDALLTELRELAQTQQDILREVHPDVGEIKEHVVEEQGAKINEIAAQIMQVADAVASRALTPVLRKVVWSFQGSFPAPQACLPDMSPGGRRSREPPRTPTAVSLAAAPPTAPDPPGPERS